MAMDNAPKGVSLDQAPPSPPSLSGPQAQMAGSMGQGQDATGSSTMQATVQTAMQIEMGLQTLASTLPSFAPIAQQMVSVLRSGIANALQQVSGAGLGTGAPQPLGAPSGAGAGAAFSPQPPPM